MPRYLERRCEGDVGEGVVCAVPTSFCLTKQYWNIIIIVVIVISLHHNHHYVHIAHIDCAMYIKIVIFATIIIITFDFCQKRLSCA